MSAASWRIDFRRGTNATSRAPATSEHLEHLLDEVEVGDAGRVVLPPAPERERRLAVELEAERALDEDARGVQRVGLEQEDEKAASVAPAKPSANRSRRDAASRSDTTSQSGASSRAANFVQPASATAAPRAQAEEASQKPQIRNAGMIASFVFEFEA